MTGVLLKKLEISTFKPMAFCQSGVAQTLAAYLYPTRSVLANQIHFIITLPDGDKIALTENSCSQGEPNKRTVLLVHGLTGSHQSGYIIRAARMLLREGYRVIRMDLRGCGAGQGLAKLPYHAGRSEDLRQVLIWLSQRYPQSLVTMIGFSLGANIVLKMAGEDSHKPTGNLDSIIAVSPPVDLLACVNRLMLPENKLFEQHFVKSLIKTLKSDSQLRYYKTDSKLHAKLNLFQFDDLYTAPIGGFKNALEYYEHSSALQYMPRITLPTLILQSKDDPVLCNSVINKIPLLSHFDTMITEKGGHVGWVGPCGDFFRYGYQWMNQLLLKWVKNHENRKAL